VGALGSNINAHIYQNLVTAGIVKKINELRAVRLEGMREKWIRPSGEYTIVRAIRDIQLYHQECSFYRGVTELANDTLPVPQTRAEFDTEIKTIEAENAELEAKFTKFDGSPIATSAAINALQQFDTNKVRLFLPRNKRNAAPLRVRKISVTWNSDPTKLAARDSLLQLIGAIGVEFQETYARITALRTKPKSDNLTDTEKTELADLKIKKYLLIKSLARANDRLNTVDKTNKAQIFR